MTTDPPFKHAEWDISRLVKFFGGNALLRRRFRAYGFVVPQEKTVAEWSRRGSIPAVWVARMFALGWALGLEPDPKDFIKVKERDHGQS